MKIQIESNILKNMFENVCFVNGTAYAGKSTMVRLLAERYSGIWCGENYHEELMELVILIQKALTGKRAFSPLIAVLSVATLTHREDIYSML